MTRYPMKFENDVTSKKALFIEPPKGYPQDCKNCGGIGELHAFIIDEKVGGPFPYVPVVDKDKALKSVFDSHYGWLWYVGKTLGLPCPVCKGLGGNANKLSTKTMTPERWAKVRTEKPIDILARKMGKKHQLTGHKERA